MKWGKFATGVGAEVNLGSGQFILALDGDSASFLVVMPGGPSLAAQSRAPPSGLSIGGQQQIPMVGGLIGTFWTVRDWSS